MTGEGTNPENWAESTECYIVWTLSWGPALENWNACVRREPRKPRPRNHHAKRARGESFRGAGGGTNPENW